LHFYAYLSGLKERKDVKRGNLNITIMRLKNGAIPGFILVFSLLFATTITTSAQEMKETCFIAQEPAAKWYPERDYHTMYVAEIEKALVRS